MDNSTQANCRIYILIESNLWLHTLTLIFTQNYIELFLLNSLYNIYLNNRNRNGNIVEVKNIMQIYRDKNSKRLFNIHKLFLMGVRYWIYRYYFENTTIICRVGWGKFVRFFFSTYNFWFVKVFNFEFEWKCFAYSVVTQN